MNKNVFGLSENIAAAVAYLGFFVTGILFLIMERENKFIRFAALQSTVFFIAMAIISWVVGWFTWIPLLGILFGLINSAIGLVVVIVWLYTALTAWKGQAVKLPILGDICWEQVHK